MSLKEYLGSKGTHIVEGYSKQIPKQIAILKKLVVNDSVINVMEIGFNAGHSAELFLESNDKVKLISFDLGYYPCVNIGKTYIDDKFPFRHRLILGDSTKTIPDFAKRNKDVKFDLIFIDGGHDYQIAKQDLENCRKLSHKNTIVVIDDTIYTKKLVTFWTIGPTKSWEEGIKNGIIAEFGREEFDKGRGMSWGKYTDKNTTNNETKSENEEEWMNITM